MVSVKRLSLLLLAIPLLAGCPQALRQVDRVMMHRWQTDYDSAERQAAAADRPLLVYYRDTRRTANRDLHRAVHSTEFKRHLEGYVCCELYSDIERDRRFVEQYGVREAPALIVVHRDGTYHALERPASMEGMISFLEGATPPGLTSVPNPQLARMPTFHWAGSIAAAERQSRERDVPALILLTRAWAPATYDLMSWIERHHVYARIHSWVLCRVDEVNPLNLQANNRFGVSQFPAVVILLPDGTHYVLERPGSADDVARFLDRFGAWPVGPEAGGADDAADASADPSAMSAP